MSYKANITKSHLNQSSPAASSQEFLLDCKVMRIWNTQIKTVINRNQSNRVPCFLTAYLEYVDLDGICLFYEDSLLDLTSVKE